MQKVEAGHNQTNSQTDISDESLTIPQEKQKRPYYRHNITNIAKINPNQETTISDQSPTAEIAIRTKKPYHRHPKVDIPYISNEDEDFLKNYSLDKLHRLAIERKFSGRQDKKVEESITAISQSYFGSKLYQQSLNLLFSTINSIEPNKTKLEKSYKLGLIRNLRVFYRVTKGVPDPEREGIISKVIDGFESYCQYAAQKFVTDKRYKHLRPTFHALIQYPDLHYLETLDQVVPQINKGPFLTYFVVNHLFKSRYEDTALKEAVIKKTEVFERLKIENREHQLGASISDLRIATVFYADPLTFLEKTAEKNRLKKRRNKSQEQSQVAEKKVRRHRLKTEHPSENTSSLEPKEKERIIQCYLSQRHELLTRQNIEYYLNQYQSYDTEIKDGVILFDSLIQKYKDMDIFGLKQIIIESIKRRRQDASVSINKYITIMSEPSFSTKYRNIPKPTVYAIISKYIYEKNVNLTAMFRELNKESLQWQ